MDPTCARAALLLWGMAVSGCDQFARVGVVDVDGRVAEGGPSAPSDSGPPGSADAGASNGGSTCTRPVVAVCDPIANEGCPAELQMQCAVDLAAHLPAGYCTFTAPLATDAGLACLNTLVTESCPPTTTCYGGECRKLCFCNDDCAGGACCVDPVGTQGFKVCGACSASDAL